MEENNQNNGENSQSQAQCPQCAAQQVEQVVEVEVNVTQNSTKAHKHNGRNKRGVSKAQATEVSANCGEIQDVVSFQEKLSGSHLKGYEGSENSESQQAQEGENSKPAFNRENRERKSRQDRRPRFDNENTDESDEKHQGPSFEKPSFKPRAVEVALDSKGFANKRQNLQKSDFVSSASVEEPKISVIARIKRMFANIFRKNSSNGAKFKKNRKDWKNKNSDKNRTFHNSKNGDFRGKKNYRQGGKRFDKNFKQTRRDNNSQSDKA